MSILDHRLFSLPAVSVLALCAATPTLAQQMTAKDAWAGLRSAAAGAGLTMSAQSTSDLGNALSINGLRIFPTSDPRALVVSMDSLRIEPRGDMIAVVPSALVTVETLISDGTALTFQIEHDGEILGALSDTDAALDFDFATLTARLVGSTRQGRPTADSMVISLTGLGAQMRAAREGSADVSIGATSVSYDFSLIDGMGYSQSGDGLIEGPRLTFTATELDALEGARTLTEATQAGITMRLALSTGPSSGNSVQNLEGMQIAMGSTSTESGLELAFVEGRLEGSLYAGAGSIQGGMGPITGSATLDGMGLDVLIPLAITPDDQQMRYAFRFDNLRPSPDLMTTLGAGIFAGDSLSLGLDVGAMGRLVRDIPIDGSEMDDDESPFDLSELRLDSVLIRVGDSEFNGTGAIRLIGGLLANMDRDMPDAEGDLTFNLVGGERLLTRVQSLNLIPVDQLFFVRMMVNGLGRPVGDDHLQSDVAIRSGGVITVNGAPLPF